MPRLVALDIAGGPAFVDALERAWSHGDAIAPLDPRLPRPAARALLDALRPTHVVGADGEMVAMVGGMDTEPGDAVVIATSGSTGTPKAVVLTAAAVEASAWATSSRLGVDPENDRWLACLPLAHIGGLSVVMRSVITGTSLEVHPGFDPEKVGRSIEDGVNLVSLVPTAFSRIDISKFKKVLVGGAAPPSGLPPNAVATYGMTETGSGVVYDGVALEGVEVAIGDGTTGQDHEVLLRGPMLLRSYRYGNDPKIAGGWLATGDAGSLDANGVLSVSGRIAEVIVTGGEKVWPITVERSLATAVGVEEVAVAGKPDGEWGSVVTAVIVASDPAKPPVIEALKEHVRMELPPWAAPKALVLVDKLPRLPGGKVDRVAISEIASTGTT